jgi:hypothetical protein
MASDCIGAPWCARLRYSTFLTGWSICDKLNADKSGGVLILVAGSFQMSQFVGYFGF